MTANAKSGLGFGNDEAVAIVRRQIVAGETLQLGINQTQTSVDTIADANAIAHPCPLNGYAIGMVDAIIESRRSHTARTSQFH